MPISAARCDLASQWGMVAQSHKTQRLLRIGHTRRQAYAVPLTDEAVDTGPGWLLETRVFHAVSRGATRVEAQRAVACARSSVLLLGAVARQQTDMRSPKAPTILSRLGRLLRC